MPMTGLFDANTNPLIVDNPTLKLVNEPGPSPTANPSNFDREIPDKSKIFLILGMMDDDNGRLSFTFLKATTFPFFVTAKLKFFVDVSMANKFMMKAPRRKQQGIYIEFLNRGAAHCCEAHSSSLEYFCVRASKK